MIRVDLYSLDSGQPFDSYISHVIPQVGETIVIVDTEGRSSLHPVVEVQHWVETRPNKYRVQTEVHVYINSTYGMSESGQI